MATRVDNTMVEWLQKMMKSIAEAKLLPDGDMPFLIALENMLIQEAKKPVDDLRSQGVLPPAQPGPTQGAPSMGGVMGMPDMSGASSELGRMMAPAAGPQ